MKAFYDWLSARDGYIVALIPSALSLAAGFGFDISGEVVASATAVVAGVLAVILARSVNPAE